MAKLTIDIVNSEKVKTLIELLSTYKDELPKKLKDSILALADNEAFELDWRYWQGEFKCMVDGVDIAGDYRIKSVNKILKRITYTPKDGDGRLMVCDGVILKKHLNLDNAKFYLDNELILEW